MKYLILTFLFLSACSSMPSMYETPENCVKAMEQPGRAIETLVWEYGKVCQAVTVDKTAFSKLNK